MNLTATSRRLFDPVFAREHDGNYVAFGRNGEFIAEDPSKKALEGQVVKMGIPLEDVTIEGPASFVAAQQMLIE